MIYLDVRTSEEFADSHYPEAIHHDVALLAEGVMPNLPKETPITIYCRSGGRASVAQRLMEQAGFTCVKNGGGLADVLSQKEA